MEKLLSKQRIATCRGLIVLLVFVVSFAMSGCSAESESATASLELTLPMRSLGPREIDPGLYRVDVSIDQTTFRANPSAGDDTWQVGLELPTDRSVSMVVEWFHNNLLLARHSQSVGPITDFTTVVINSSDYVTQGPGFDFDSDGFTNLQELHRNTNPSDVRNIDVEIPLISDLGVPGINGNPGVVWDATNIVDWRGEELLINNLMISSSSNPIDRVAEYRWKALHNGENLYLIVFGETTASETPQADSKVGVFDDTINIYIDGDNSKGTSYDGVNDFHLAIPLLKLLKPGEGFEGTTVLFDENNHMVRNEAGEIKVNDGTQDFFVAHGPLEENNSDDEDRRIQRGSNSLPVPERIKFRTGQGRILNSSPQPQQVYEIRLKLEEVGITVGEPFGFEIQVDDDRDGGDREARFGWKHPARNNETNMDSNNTSSNPSYMGTAILQ